MVALHSTMNASSSAAVYLLKDNPMVLEEFITRFKKNCAFVALSIETRRKWTKSNT